MKKSFRKTTFLSALAIAVPAMGMAQDKVEASAGADLVSGYIWRGQDLGGVSIQPTLSVSYKGFSLSAWGTAGIEKEDTKEIDLTLGYATGGFSISVTDYWFNGGPGYFHYGSHNTNHTFEAQIGYDFGPLALNWYTNFAGTDGVNNGGNRAYSSYISATVPFTLAGLELDSGNRSDSVGHRLLQLFRSPCMQRFQRFHRMRHQHGSRQGNKNHRFILRSSFCKSHRKPTH